MIGPPLTDGLLDLLSGHGIVHRQTGQFRKFLIRSKTKGDDLSQPHAAVQRFAGQYEMSERLLGTDRPVLNFQGIGPYKDAKDEGDKEQQSIDQGLLKFT